MEFTYARTECYHQHSTQASDSPLELATLSLQARLYQSIGCHHVVRVADRENANYLGYQTYAKVTLMYHQVFQGRLS